MTFLAKLVINYKMFGMYIKNHSNLLAPAVVWEKFILSKLPDERFSTLVSLIV